MKSAIFVSVLVVATLFVEGAVAQHEGHQVPQTATTPDKAADNPANKQACGMMADHAQVTKLADQLAASFAAIENEKDPAALHAKLSQHGELLKQLHAAVQGSADKMEQMKGKMMKGKMGGGNKQ